MEIAPFELERYFARWEFEARHNLGASDPEPLRLDELLALADPECAEWWERLSLGYTESTGAARLRAAIASLYASVDPAEVLTFAGAEEAIFLCMHTLLRAGDEVFVVRPCYQSLREVARAIGARVVDLPLDEARGWEFPLDLLHRRMSGRTRMVVINFPHNPTGAVLAADVYAEVVRLCAQHGVLLFSDEVYRLLEHDAAHALPAAVDGDAPAVSLGVTSKAFGLAGLRIGWIATHERSLLESVARLKDYTTICNSAPSEVLATMALRAQDTVLTRIHGILDANLALLNACFERNQDAVRWVRPAGGTVAFPRLLKRDADELAAELMRRDGVLIVPGSVFGEAGGHFRIGYGRRDLAEALPLFEAHLRS